MFSGARFASTRGSGDTEGLPFAKASANYLATLLRAHAFHERAVGLARRHCRCDVMRGKAEAMCSAFFSAFSVGVGRPRAGGTDAAKRGP